MYTVCDLRSYPGLKKAAQAYGMTEQNLEANLTDHNPIDRLEPLARAGVKLFHIHGDKDSVVPVEKNAGLVVKRYKQLGGEAALEIIPGGGHEVSERFFRSRTLAQFLATQALAAAKAESEAAASTEKPSQ
jgi:pimeloyl-ACP methyl ester carboxylesterase